MNLAQFPALSEELLIVINLQKLNSWPSLLPNLELIELYSLLCVSVPFIALGNIYYNQYMTIEFI